VWPESDTASSPQRRFLASRTRKTGPFLAEKFAGTAGNLPPCFGGCRSLPGIGSLAYHYLMYYGFVERRGKNMVVYLYLPDNFSGGIINWKLHPTFPSWIF
jgi:hypothetical protein